VSGFNTGSLFIMRPYILVSPFYAKGYRVSYLTIYRRGRIGSRARSIISRFFEFVFTTNRARRSGLSDISLGRLPADIDPRMAASPLAMRLASITNRD
jgi:hypothetical protein